MNIKKIMDNHLLWIRKEGGCRADLTGADLTEIALDEDWSFTKATLIDVNLSGVDLTGFNLSEATLCGANLRNSDLHLADLTGANLTGANLNKANLIEADIKCADLSFAQLIGADLSHAYLNNSSLFRANLNKSRLFNTDLRGANLQKSNLSESVLNEALLENAKIDGTNFSNAIVPTIPEGDLIGWKKLRDEVVAKLLIPAEAKRSIATGTKCRASFVKVLNLSSKIYNLIKIGHSIFQYNFIYEKGKMVYADKWNENRWEECTGGIHFFLSEEEAVYY